MVAIVKRNKERDDREKRVAYGVFCQPQKPEVRTIVQAKLGFGNGTEAFACKQQKHIRFRF
jgi:hypothetical protein